MLKNLLIFLISVSVSSCVTMLPTTNTYSGGSSTLPTNTSKPAVQIQVAENFPEGFDGASKSKYEGGNISTTSGQWYLDNAIMGGADNDQKTGTKAVRMKETAKLTMGFDLPKGIQQVRFKYGVYQLDKASTFELWVSTNAGSSWNQVETTLTASEKTLREALFNVNIQQPARIEIRKTDGSANRLDIDDVVLMTYRTGNTTPPTPKPDPSPVDNVIATTATRDNNSGLGNPSGAVARTSSGDNYLMEKGDYTLSYNKSKGTANWVSWHLSTAWRGEAARQNDFRPDPDVPKNWAVIMPSEYINTGFDRGHLCPSDDRNGTIEENQETFYMTNMTPQAPDFNRGNWKVLEEYERTLLRQGNEVYIIAGPLGQGGTGANGFAKTIGKNDEIIVPASLWKIIVVLPIGQNDLKRIDENTRVIAVNIPNDNAIGTESWRKFRISVDELERLTGYDFLSNIPVDIQAVIEARVDN